MFDQWREYYQTPIIYARLVHQIRIRFIYLV